jgi:uncharacterized membrane protein YciS (DUF1049 family)
MNAATNGSLTTTDSSSFIDQNSAKNCTLVYNNITSTKPVFDTSSLIAIALIAFVVVSGMIFAVVMYKMRINYLLQRQINMFKVVK